METLVIMLLMLTGSSMEGVLPLYGLLEGRTDSGSTFCMLSKKVEFNNILESGLIFVVLNFDHNTCNLSGPL